MNKILRPRTNRHIYGEDAWKFAAWLSVHTPPAYKILCVNTVMFSYLTGLDSDRPIMTSKLHTPNFRKDDDRPSVLIVSHDDVEETECLHASVAEPDVIYTVQEGSTVDMIEGVEMVDTATIFRQNLHFYGSGFGRFFESVIGNFGMFDEISAFEVGGENAYKEACFKTAGYVWTHSEQKPDWKVDSDIIKLRNGFIV